MKTLINKLTKNIFLPLAIYAGVNYSAYSQEKKTNDSIVSPKIIEVIDGNKDSMPDKYFILEDFPDSLIQTVYTDINFDGTFDLLKLDYYDKKKYSINSLSHMVEDDKEILDSYKKLKVGEYFINCGKEEFKRLDLIRRLSKKDLSKSLIRSADNNKDGLADEYLLWDDSKENIFSSKYLDTNYNNSFDLIILKEYDKKTDKIIEKSYDFKNEVPEFFTKLKPEEIIGSEEGQLNLIPTKIQTLDIYPQDGIYDEFTLWQDLPDKIMQIKFSDRDRDKNFDCLGFFYDKKTNQIGMEVPRDYAEKLSLIKSLNLKKGDTFFYCKKDYFKISLSDYMKK